jgi:UDP-N-acetylglucosamine--N-acetylmuramyl-(pentapeptide) pyrophosphoryl-undecaprenol N-acetylglucosamine transferase
VPGIVFTGGGSAGHVTPNLALISKLQSKGWEVEYIGSKNGIEQGIVEEWGIPFHSISSGKLRRYFDLKNFKDPFKVVKGIWDAYRVLKRIRPQLVFSKGGFVTVPVVLAARAARIPVIIHESDFTPGLANKIAIPFATKVCVTFPETLKKLGSDSSENKTIHTGIPIRPELFQGHADRGWSITGLSPNKPVLFIMGGSLGAGAINRAIREQLDELLKSFHIIHICGKGNVDTELMDRKHYKQFEYVSKELPDLLAIADVVVSRAGATSIYEFLALRKPMLLIPLTKQASRGDQILNAQSFETSGYCRILYEENLSAASLHEAVSELYQDRSQYQERMQASGQLQSVDIIIGIIEALGRKGH